jgi:hypothetical protein
MIGRPEDIPDPTRIQTLEKAINLLVGRLDMNGVTLPLDDWIRIASLLKTIPFFARALTRLVTSLYNGFIGGEFVDVLKNLISGQLRRAYEQAWKDEGTGGKLPPELEAAAADKIAKQQAFVEPYYHDIIDARVNGTALEPLTQRVDLWTNRYQEAYDEAIGIIHTQNGSKERWVLGATEQHCPFCRSFNGIVAYAHEWETLGIRPQNAPNPALTGKLEDEDGCEGWRCDCKREMTTEPRTENAFDLLLGILASSEAGIG